MADTRKSKKFRCSNAEAILSTGESLGCIKAYPEERKMVKDKESKFCHRFLSRVQVRIMKLTWFLEGTRWTWVNTFAGRKGARELDVEI